MSTVTLFSKTGTKSAQKATLPKAVFDLEVSNLELIKQAYLRYLANARGAHAKTLTRAEVRGGGRKPWRQKGTGRARAGSIRSPIWKGGGITFGPTGEENFQKALPRNAKRLAIRQALSLAQKDGRVKAIEDFEVKTGKVKAAVALLDKLEADRNVLIILEENDTLSRRATNNIPGVKTTAAQKLNVFDILNADSIIITTPALKQLESWLGGKA